MEKTSPDTIPSEMPDDTKMTCNKCGKTFDRKITTGIFKVPSWLIPFCDECGPRIQADYETKEQERIAAQKIQAAQERTQRIINNQIRDLGGKAHYEIFKRELYNPELNNTHDWFNFMGTFPIEAKNLFVYGPTGSGKTFLSIAKIRTLFEKSPPGTARWFTAEQVMAEIMGKGRTSPFDRQKSIQWLADIDALVIDEIDKLRPNENYVNSLQEVMDTRERNKKYGLIVISNKDLKSIAELMGNPIADRIDARIFEKYAIPDTTKSARGLLRKQAKFN